MIDFEYCVPRSIEEALFLLKGRRGETKVLAGGTDLVVQMKDERARPAILVDVKKIPELNRLELSADETLHIGAAVPLSKIASFPAVIRRFSILQRACLHIGSERIRNRATMGGNICNAAPSADSVPPLLCLGARAIVAHIGGSRIVPMDSFFRGPGQTVLADDELLVEIEIAVPPVDSAGCYLRHTTREAMDIAVVGGASFLFLTPHGKQCNEVRIALGAVSPTPMRVPEAETLLTGKTLTDQLIEEASIIAADAASPITDVRGSAAYRKELAKVIISRTLKEAWRTLNTRN